MRGADAGRSGAIAKIPGKVRAGEGGIVENSLVRRTACCRRGKIRFDEGSYAKLLRRAVRRIAVRCIVQHQPHIIGACRSIGVRYAARAWSKPGRAATKVPDE